MNEEFIWQGFYYTFDFLSISISLWLKWNRKQLQQAKGEISARNYENKPYEDENKTNHNISRHGNQVKAEYYSRNSEYRPQQHINTHTTKHWQTPETPCLCPYAALLWCLIWNMTAALTGQQSARTADTKTRINHDKERKTASLRD